MDSFHEAPVFFMGVKKGGFFYLFSRVDSFHGAAVSTLLYRCITVDSINKSLSYTAHESITELSVRTAIVDAIC